MSKILVDVFVPVAGRRSDVFIPYEIRFNEVAELLRALLASDLNLGGDSVRDAVVCNRDTGEVLDVNRSAQEMGLENGARLMMV